MKAIRPWSVPGRGVIVVFAESARCVTTAGPVQVEVAMRVKDVATRPLVWTSAEESVRHAARQLGTHQIGALIVGVGGRPVGILTDWDIVQAVADEVDLDKSSVGDYMTPVVVAIEEDAAVPDAMRQMQEYRVRHLLVLRRGKPDAMLSARDLLEGAR